MPIDEMLPKAVRKALKGRLLAKEKILFAVPGFTIFRSRGRWIWPVYFGLFRPPILIVTTRRLLIVARGFIRTIFYGWDLNILTWANFEQGWLADRVTVRADDLQTHLLFPTKIRRATKQLVHQIWQLIAARGKKRKPKRKKGAA